MATVWIRAVDVGELVEPAHSVGDGSADVAVLSVPARGRGTTPLSVRMPMDPATAARCGRQLRRRRLAVPITIGSLVLLLAIPVLGVVGRSVDSPVPIRAGFLAVVLYAVAALLALRPVRQQPILRGDLVEVRGVHPVAATEWTERNPGRVRIAP